MAMAGVATAVRGSSPHCTLAAAASSSAVAVARASTSNAKCASGGYTGSALATGQKLRRCVIAFPLRAARGFVAGAMVAELMDSEPDRLRQNNLSRQLGSRKRNRRKERDTAAGQGASCLAPIRGQVRPGFEGVQMPLYGGIPKLTGIAGGRRSDQAQRSITRTRRSRNVQTMAIPENAVWITALEAVTVACLMGGVAVVAGIFINIKIETSALKEYYELKEKGQLPEDMIVPEGDWDLEEPLFVLQRRELSGNPQTRNRPIREEIEPEATSDVDSELEVVTSDNA